MTKWSTITSRKIQTLISKGGGMMLSTGIDDPFMGAELGWWLMMMNQFRLEYNRINGNENGMDE